jgi:hypothetical protein
MVVVIDATEVVVMSLEATRALKSAGAARTQPQNYMAAARQLRSETIAAGAGSVLARTAEAIRNLLALQPVPLRRSRPV